MRTIRLSKKAGKFIKKRTPKEQRQISEKLDALKADPRPNDSVGITGEKGLFRVTIGEFRAGYEYTDSEVEVLLVERKDGNRFYAALKRIMKGRKKLPKEKKRPKGKDG